MTDINIALKVLNEALIADPVAIETLINHRVLCNDALADHPNVQVRRDDRDGCSYVGLLGILNGVLEPMTGQRIAAVEDDNGKLLEFIVYKAEEIS